MDKEFVRRLRNRGIPFHGVTVTTEETLLLSELRKPLIAAVRILHSHWQTSSLYKLVDWHEHDGYETDADPSSWKTLLSFLVSEKTLGAMDMDDDFVRLGFFPAEREFYLRVYVSSDPWTSPFPGDDPRKELKHGDFDVTCSTEIANEIVGAMERLGVRTVSMNAQEYFLGRDGTGRTFLPGEPIPPGVIK